MKKKKKLTKGAKIFFLLFGLFVVLVFCYFYFIDHSVRGIFIKNNLMVGDSDIILKAELDDYPNFYFVSSSSIKKKLLELPNIKSVKVSKRFFHEIHIDVEEYKTLFLYNEIGKVVLENGQEIENNDDLSVPVLINYVPDIKYDSFIEKMKKIDSSIINKISEIKYDPNEYDDDRFLLYMNDKNYVYITLTKIDVLNKYDEAVTQLNGKNGILYLDSGNYFVIK